MEKKCTTRAINCDNQVGCRGCGFQHFDKIREDGNSAIAFLKDEYFKLCSKNRRGTGGRVALDTAFRALVLKEAKNIVPGFPDLIEVHDLEDVISIGGQSYRFRVKCDGAFKFDKKRIFIEIKGYGDDSNSVLSAITAAQLVRQSDKFKECKFYYLGSGSAVAPEGLNRDNFFQKNRIKVAPYVAWAEEKELIKFYGIRDVVDLLKDMKEFCEGKRRSW